MCCAPVQTIDPLGTERRDGLLRESGIGLDGFQPECRREVNVPAGCRVTPVQWIESFQKLSDHLRLRLAA